ncbi:MAG: ATP-binding protein [Planctomycetes bacterium]|nr:ATP-binding protein [Planctomycetota bacterium]
MSRRLTFPPQQGVLRQLRSRVRELAVQMGAASAAGDKLALVVDELVNNAIEHGAGYRQRNLDLVLEFQLVADRMQVAFFDPEMPAPSVQELARALAASANGVPTLDSERGRGLFLMSIYLDDLRVEVAPAGGLRLVGTVQRR